MLELEKSGHGNVKNKKLPVSYNRGLIITMDR